LKNPEFDTANSLDYSIVNSYWKNADPSIMGPYMMDGFGFPANAGRFRFRAESVIVQQLIHDAKVDTTGTVLDLGSGVGYWAEYFALKFKKVVAVEASMPLFESMVQRCFHTITSLQSMAMYCLLNPKAGFHLSSLADC